MLGDGLQTGGVGSQDGLQSRGASVGCAQLASIRAGITDISGSLWTLTRATQEEWSG